MDMNLRIDAVFSLVDNSDSRNHGVIVVKQEPADDSADVPSDTDSASSPLSHWHDKQRYLDHGIDFDAPPPLSLETDPVPKDAVSVPSAPPVLEPVVPIIEYGNNISPRSIEKELPRSRKKCCKIDPSYIVLTKVDKYIPATKNYVNFRTFKRKYKECLNICKKTHFRRQLESGKDVFNVKTPSKQRHLEYSYAGKQQKQAYLKDNTGRTNNAKRLAKMLEEHKLQRIRRTVSRVPRDFTETLNQKSILSHERISPSDSTEKISSEKTELELLEQERKKELKRLKKQIMTKRVMNKRQKTLRNAMKNSFPSYIKPGTSNVSGRQRKASKYLNGDFALTSKDIHYVRLSELEKRRLKKEQKLLRESEQRKLKKERTGKQESKYEVVIDNPEKDRVHKISLSKPDAKMKKKRKSPKEKVSESERDTPFRRQSIEISDGKHIIHPSKMKRSASSIDGVLIQDVPDANHVIRGILQTPNLIDNSELPIEDSRVQAPSVNFNANSNTLFDTQEMQDDKFKKFRIPSSVQRLFKVKTEPVDPDDAVKQDTESVKFSGNADNGLINPAKPVIVSQPFPELFSLMPPINGQTQPAGVLTCSSSASVSNQPNGAMNSNATLFISNTDKGSINAVGGSIQQNLPFAALLQSICKNTASHGVTPLPSSSGPRLSSAPSQPTHPLNPLPFVNPAQYPQIVTQTSTAQSQTKTVTQPAVGPSHTVRNVRVDSSGTQLFLVNMDGKTVVVSGTPTSVLGNAQTSSSPTTVRSALDTHPVGTADSTENTLSEKNPVISGPQLKNSQFTLSCQNRDGTIKANLVKSYRTPQIAYVNGNHSSSETNPALLKNHTFTTVTSSGLHKTNPVSLLPSSFLYRVNGDANNFDIKVIKSEHAGKATTGISLLKQETVDGGITNGVSSNICLVKQNHAGSSVKSTRLGPTSESEETVKENPKPFAETVSAREERLRKLKELLKQQTKAVEKLRKNKVKD